MIEDTPIHPRFTGLMSLPHCKLPWGYTIIWWEWKSRTESVLPSTSSKHIVTTREPYWKWKIKVVCYPCFPQVNWLTMCTLKKALRPCLQECITAREQLAASLGNRKCAARASWVAKYRTSFKKPQLVSAPWKHLQEFLSHRGVLWMPLLHQNSPN